MKPVVLRSSSHIPATVYTGYPFIADTAVPLVWLILVECKSTPWTEVSTLLLNLSLSAPGVSDAVRHRFSHVGWLAWALKPLPAAAIWTLSFNAVRGQQKM